MSTKFEQLLDLIVNEETDKANELFHAIVVEKSREIYENLIAEEEEEDMDEASEEEDESVDEAEEDEDESVDESEELEDSYSMEADDEEDQGGFGGDATDDLGGEVGAGDDDGFGGDAGGEEGGEDKAIFDIKNAIAELEAAFAELEQAQGGEEGGFGDEEEPEDDFGGDVSGDDEQMGAPAFEGRRVTREYVEKVGNDWEKSGSQKGQGQYVGSGSGDKEGAPVEGRSPVSSGKGKPTTGATAANIAKSHHEGGTNTGTSPAGKAGGFLSAAKDMNTGNQNVPGGKVSVKGLTKVANGHGAEKKGSGPGPVGSGTGEKAGQTSVTPVKQFLKPAN
jgi:hypothetical protein